MGWSSVIYFAALAGVSPEYHEAAIVDGATKFQRVLHIDLPFLAPTMTMLLILNCGSILSIGFEKAFALQNDLNIGVSEIISTYVYKVGLINRDISFSTAISPSQLLDRKSTRLNSSHPTTSRMPSSA